jgi:hypothetical protein
MATRLILAATFAFLIVGALFAQDAAQPAPFTDIENLRLENTRLEGVIVQRAVKDWEAKVAALKADIEKARPGFTWDAQTGQFSPIPQKKEP